MPRGPDPDVRAKDILEIFVKSAEPAFVASEIANKLEVTDNTARNRLDRLHEDGLIAKKKPGKRTVLYWITDEGRKYYAEATDFD